MGYCNIIREPEFQDYIESLLDVDKEGIVTSESMKNVLLLKPLQLFQDYTKLKNIEEILTENFYLELLEREVNCAIRNKIAEFDSEILDYNLLNGVINCMKYFDFEMIWKKDYKYKPSYSDKTQDESEYYFFQKEYGMLLCLDTIDRYRVNSINLYCEGQLKDEDNKKYFSFQNNKIRASETYEIEADLSNGILGVVQTIIDNFNLNQTWRTIKTSDFYSYLSHDKGNNESLVNSPIWEEQMLYKLQQFPKYVQKAITIDLSMLIEKEERVVKKLGFCKDYFISEEIIDNLTESDLYIPYLNENLFDISHSPNFDKAITPDIYKKLSNAGISKPYNFADAVISRAFKVIDLKEEETLKEMKKVLYNLSFDDLLKVQKTQSVRSWYKHSNELATLTEDLLKIKKIQEKLKNFN